MTRKTRKLFSLFACSCAGLAPLFVFAAGPTLHDVLRSTAAPPLSSGWGEATPILGAAPYFNGAPGGAPACPYAAVTDRAPPDGGSSTSQESSGFSLPTQSAAISEPEHAGSRVEHSFGTSTQHGVWSFLEPRVRFRLSQCDSELGTMIDARAALREQEEVYIPPIAEWLRNAIAALQGTKTWQRDQRGPAILVRVQNRARNWLIDVRDGIRQLRKNAEPQHVAAVVGSLLQELYTTVNEYPLPRFENDAYAGGARSYFFYVSYGEFFMQMLLGSFTAAMNVWLGRRFTGDETHHTTFVPFSSGEEPPEHSREVVLSVAEDLAQSVATRSRTIRKIKGKSSHEQFQSEQASDYLQRSVIALSRLLTAPAEIAVLAPFRGHGLKVDPPAPVDPPLLSSHAQYWTPWNAFPWNVVSRMFALQFVLRALEDFGRSMRGVSISAETRRGDAIADVNEQEHGPAEFAVGQVLKVLDHPGLWRYRRRGAEMSVAAGHEDYVAYPVREDRDYRPERGLPHAVFFQLLLAQEERSEGMKQLASKRWQRMDASASSGDHERDPASQAGIGLVDADAASADDRLFALLCLSWLQGDAGGAPDLLTRDHSFAPYMNPRERLLPPAVLFAVMDLSANSYLRKRGHDAATASSAAAAANGPAGPAAHGMTRQESPTSSRGGERPSSGQFQAAPPATPMPAQAKKMFDGLVENFRHSALERVVCAFLLDDEELGHLKSLRQALEEQMRLGRITADAFVLLLDALWRGTYMRVDPQPEQGEVEWRRRSGCRGDADVRVTRAGVFEVLSVFWSGPTEAEFGIEGAVASRSWSRDEAEAVREEIERRFPSAEE